MSFILDMKINFNPMYKPVFTSNARRYNDSFGDYLGCNTWFFRDDVNWKELTEYELEHFKNKEKVNIVMFAASDGSEAYTKIISLLEKGCDKVKKFFPIKAYDIDNVILKAAQSGLIKTTMFDRIELQINCDNYENYFEKTDNTLEISNDKSSNPTKVLKAKDDLTQRVEFKYGDMFQKIKEINDNSNTILMCRNILGYFTNDKIENFVELAKNSLKSGSLFVVGDHDSVLCNIEDVMKNFNFKRVIKNVYQKI